jgi:hypothetical protein
MEESLLGIMAIRSRSDAARKEPAYIGQLPTKDVARYIIDALALDVK